MKKSKFNRAIILTVVTLVGALLPVLPSQAAPSITILNPSGYSGANLRISTKEDAAGETSYHLVAWTGDTPSNPLVEFEIAATPSVPGGPSGPSLATVTATRVGTDTFEGELSTSTVNDGQYFLRAILYSGFLGPGTGAEVARSEVPVTISSSATTAPNTVEMTYPENGGPIGFWKAASSPGIAVVTGFASSGTTQVRALYSTSAPGSTPVWTQCGTGAVSQQQFRVRCTLEADVNPAAVRAIAAVANRTPAQAPASPSADDTGDAHRALPYLQNPTSVTFEPASSQTERNECTPLVVEVADQSGVPVAGLNIDFHAVGPDDQLRFATQAGVSSGFQPPDAAHTAREGTVQCDTLDAENQQSEHSVPGGDDVKHIESTAGTNNLGLFTIVLLSATGGGTQVTAWGDENDDDNLTTSSEASGTAVLGWGQAPPPPPTVLTMDPSSETNTVGECVRFTVRATQSGTAQAGRNVDVHIKDPSGVAFCNPGDSNMAPPDGGSHTGDRDNDAENTRHAEGATNASGDVIFGVTSSDTGETSISVWHDEVDNDIHDGAETGTAGTIEWLSEGGRDISLGSSKRSVRKGKNVTFSGRISGSDACMTSQGVKLQARTGKRGRWGNIATTSTDDQGAYSVTKRVKKTKQYRSLAPKNGPCNKARSKVIKVRATR